MKETKKQTKAIVLQKIQEIKNELRTRRSKPINFANALLTRDNKPLFFPRTINVIQGKAGYKAPSEELMNTIGAILQGQISRKQLLQYLCEELDCSKRTVILRIKQVMKEDRTILIKGRWMRLASRVESKEVIYYMEESSECRTGAE